MALIATDSRRIAPHEVRMTHTDHAAAADATGRPSDRPAPPYGLAPSGYRLPAATRLGRVSLQIADLERSIAYYTQTLGLRVLRRAGAVAELGPHDDDTVLVALHEKQGVRTVGRRGLLGLYHFAVLLPDRASLGRFVRHLAETGTYAGMSDHLVSEAVYLTDPDGLGIEVYVDRPRASWRHEQRQLVMATDPLDVADLVAAAGDAPWTGAPAGTVIGHVHLYVSDIDTGAAFYHEALGFDRVVWSYPGALFLSAGGYHHHLGTNTWAAHSPLASDDDARLLEWTIQVPRSEDADGAAESLTAAGYPVSRDAGGDVLTRDPWGTLLRLHAVG